MRAPAISRTRAAALPFSISAAAWVDLLGYGSMIGEAELNPVDPRAKIAVTRLRAFHRIVAEHSGRHFKTLVINDGAVAYRDLSLRSNGITHDFLQSAILLFDAISELERRNGWPGARMVVAAGLPARGRPRGLVAAPARVERILERMAAGEIAPEQAVREAGSIQRYSDDIPQLQANFAFTRAYVADVGGSSAGLGGPRMFVDTALFTGGTTPPWVTAGPPIPFEEPKLGLQCTLAPVTGLEAPGRGDGLSIPGLRDGLEIGEAIAPTLSLRKLIKAARETS
jgi:hypothetical protein